MLRLSEHYSSVQGEGPRVGTLTQFVRFAGCNMRCPGWPCDTQHAIDPAIWRHQSEKVDPHQLRDRVHEEAKRTGAYNVCLTGGEPFLQPSEELFEFIQSIQPGLFTFEVFTNGSFPFPAWTKDPHINMLFTMDWKLRSSGEGNTALSTRIENARWLQASDGIKFVVNFIEDMFDALNEANSFKADGYEGSFWLGRVWGSKLTDQDLVSFMMEHKLHDWRLNVQVHKLIWEPDARSV